VVGSGQWARMNRKVMILISIKDTIFSSPLYLVFFLLKAVK
jgi:hypothetical protein